MSLAFNVSYPSIAPSTIAIGAIYSHATSFIVTSPIFGALFQKAERATSAEDVLKSKEAASAGAAWATSLTSSALQSYGLAALLKLTSTTTYKAAALLGSLVLAVQTAPQLIRQVIVQKQPIDVVASTAAVAVLDTVGLALVLTWASGNPALDNVAPSLRK